MKANVPEKIYLPNNPVLSISNLNERTSEDDIEYTRTDALKQDWKPSIAQLNALSIVSKGNAPDDIEAIVSLYQDLKKL